ncbi:MAG: MaoC family dehydratase N-terminal domain-containing protein [Deltaproteobacteria bacterium]|nr:MaoC family dehydratase N-terminal domain-containing protein [Deltaproteobacteria bacterium]
MSKLSRRRFIQIAGSGATALGIGMRFPQGAWAQKGTAQKSKKDVDSRWEEWEFYYPNKYDSEDTKVLKEFQAELDEVNKKGKGFKVDDLISGKLSGMDAGSGPGGRGTKITWENILKNANTYLPSNPLFTDKEYAKKSRFGNPIAWPLISSLEVMPAMPKTKGIGDYMVVSAHNDTNSYFKPFYEGDTLYSITVEQHCTDITPSEGSYYRTFCMSGKAKVYNQKGELVGEAANVLKESFRRYKDKSKRNKSGAHAWESPDWWTRPAYQYTDKDWDNIIGMWKKENVRGKEPLYWDEVKVGDQPTPTSVFFVMETQGDIAMSVPQFSVDIKKNVLEPKVFKTMVKNAQGIWVLPEYKEKKARGAGGPGGGMPDMPGGGEMPAGGQGDQQGPGGQGSGGQQGTGGGMPGGEQIMEQPQELANRDGRALVQNSLAAKFAAGMITDWMGDAGWLQRVHWDIMELPPGSQDYIDFTAYPTVIPPIPDELRPDLFDKYPYMDKVPFMRGCRAAWHCMEGDLIISKAYVTKKYNIGSDYFVDLTWWCHTYDNYLIEEGSATVKLPKKA